MNKFLQTNLLSKAGFMKQLQREKRLADRSKAPLSMVLFRLNDPKDAELGVIYDFLIRLQNNIRETDMVGYLGKNRVGLLLADTDLQGMQKCIEKIISAYHPSFSIIAGTYPSQVFDSLTKESPDLPDAYPLFLDLFEKPKQFSQLLKRSIDIVGAFTGILLLSPIMLMVAIAIKRTSSGPVIFKQIRLGERGVPFTFYKFRSMYANTDHQIHQEYITHLIQGDLESINQGSKEKPVYKMRSDPRITRVGRLIRKTSIDELPQLFNVLKGEMSLVGPRPPLPYEAEKYQPWHLRRILELKPGITGLWQVGGRSETSFDDMVRLDLRYSRNWSLSLDFKILLKTVKVVFQSTGAY